MRSSNIADRRPGAAAPIAVSMGDPAGIGPEIIAKAWAARDTHALPPFVAVGDARATARASGRVRSRGLAISPRATQRSLRRCR
jgi:4-hydroxy-L-threonine phosphate dehydrogenase PdxA